MKKYLFMFIAALIFFNVWSAGEVSAQVSKNIEADIEFEFRVGEKIYPAGTYRLETLGQDNVLRLRSTEKNELSLTVAARAAYSAKKQTPKLVFRRIGEKYYLAKIFLSEDNWGYSIRAPRQAKSEEKLASAKTIEVRAKN